MHKIISSKDVYLNRDENEDKKRWVYEIYKNIFFGKD